MIKSQRKDQREGRKEKKEKNLSKKRWGKEGRKTNIRGESVWIQ